MRRARKENKAHRDRTDSKESRVRKGNPANKGRKGYKGSAASVVNKGLQAVPDPRGFEAPKAEQGQLEHKAPRGEKLAISPRLPT